MVIIAIICLFGPDGSGKSSLARILVKSFRVKGLRVRVSWMRGTHTFASVFAKFLSGFRVFRGFDNPYYNISIPGKMARFWCFLEFISMLPIFFSRFLLPKLFGYTVVGERGLLDFLVWVSLVTRSPRFSNSFLGHVVFTLALRYSSNIYVRADLDVLRARRNDMNFIFLKYQLAIYDVLARVLNTPIIDTSHRSVEESFKDILDCLRGFGYEFSGSL